MEAVRGSPGCGSGGAHLCARHAGRQGLRPSGGGDGELDTHAPQECPAHLAGGGRGSGGHRLQGNGSGYNGGLPDRSVNMNLVHRYLFLHICMGTPVCLVNAFSQRT